MNNVLIVSIPMQLKEDDLLSFRDYIIDGLKTGVLVFDGGYEVKMRVEQIPDLGGVRFEDIPVVDQVKEEPCPVSFAVMQNTKPDDTVSKIIDGIVSEAQKVEPPEPVAEERKNDHVFRPVGMGAQVKKEAFAKLIKYRNENGLGSFKELAKVCGNGVDSDLLHRALMAEPITLKVWEAIGAGIDKINAKKSDCMEEAKVNV